MAASFVWKKNPFNPHAPSARLDAACWGKHLAGASPAERASLWSETSLGVRAFLARALPASKRQPLWLSFVSGLVFLMLPPMPGYGWCLRCDCILDRLFNHACVYVAGENEHSGITPSGDGPCSGCESKIGTREGAQLPSLHHQKTFRISTCVPLLGFSQKLQSAPSPLLSEFSHVVKVAEPTTSLLAPVSLRSHHSG